MKTAAARANPPASGVEAEGARSSVVAAITTNISRNVETGSTAGP